MKRLIILPILFFFISCGEKHTIEVYLLNERIPNKYGVPVRSIKEFRDGLNNYPDDAPNYEFATYDTIPKQIIFADAFAAPPRNKWQKKPFINDGEILGLNPSESKIKISKSGAIKIFNLKHDHGKGHQFIIADNGAPVMTGYFWNRFSSLESNADNILYLYSTDKSKEYYDFEMMRTNWKPSYVKKTNFKNYPKLLAAFRESGRLESE